MNKKAVVDGLGRYTAPAVVVGAVLVSAYITYPAWKGFISLFSKTSDAVGAVTGEVGNTVSDVGNVTSFGFKWLMSPLHQFYLDWVAPYQKQ